MNDIDKRGIKRIFCLGDIIAKGVHPHECIKIIKNRCEVVIKGNCEDRFTILENLEQFDEKEKSRIIWNQSLMSKEDIEYLRNLPFCFEFYMSGSYIRLFHSSPNSYFDVIDSFDSFKYKNKLFMPSEYTLTNKVADIAMYGHLHYQYMDRQYNKTIVNVGSVGASMELIHNKQYDSNINEITQAFYCVINGDYGAQDYSSSLSFELIRVPYDIDKELNSNVYNSEKQMYENTIRKGEYADIEKLYNTIRQRGINLDI